MTVVIGTAGHIDHGKTTLLRALTGIDADRLPEERARGMTIDVGYAHLDLEDGTALDFVDVPGHDRLIGNMLVGAGEIDAALLVVAADDGPRAQTIEHLELLDALRIRGGLAVVTKTDAVGAERTAEVVAATRALLERTSLGGIDVLPMSATTSAGLDAVRASLRGLRDQIAGRTAAAGEPTASSLAIDRVFTVKGRGVVVTGTLRGAEIGTGMRLRVVPGTADRGDSDSVRVRGVQVHGRAVPAAGPGRVALNLVAGDAARRLVRGAVLTTDPAIVATDLVLVALEPPAGITSGAAEVGVRSGLPADRARVSVHLGTARTPAAVGRSGRDGQQLKDGAGTAILRLDRPIAAGPGDRFVLRRESPGGTVAGGLILDPEPARGVARRRSTPERLAALAVAPPGAAAWRAARLDLHGAWAGPPPAVAFDVASAIDELLVAEVGGRPGLGGAELLRTGTAALRRRVGSIGMSGSVHSGAGNRAVAERIVAERIGGLVAAGHLVRDGDRLRLPGQPAAETPADLAAEMDRLVAALSAFGPPGLAMAARDVGCRADGIRMLEQSNRIVRVEDDLAWAGPTWQALAERALALALIGPLTPAAYRDATGVSRKYVMAILEDLDRRAILRRTPAGHVPGPRAPQISASVAVRSEAEQ